MNETLLITGAGGQLGQLVLEALLKTATHPALVATTRQPDKLAAFAQRGVSVRAADFNQPETLSAAFAGATRMLLISTDAVGARVEQHRQAIQAAVAAGVQHIVYTSWPHADSSPALVAPDHAATEQILRESGVSYTILRNHLYSENLLGSLKSALATGVLAGSTGGGKAAYVTRQDCANAAAAVLLAPAAASCVLDISGPKAYTQAEIAQLASELTGQPIQAIDLPDAEYRQALVGAGLPEFVADLLLSFDQAIRKGDAAEVSSSVQDLTGQAPEDLAGFLRAHLDALK
ncbi:MAG: SDR family oxidoreductase [Candidatus Sericytochromatia bacterium]